MIAIDNGALSRWKIDTPFENWLSYKADHSHFFKVLYCNYYAFFDKQYYETGIQMAKKSMEMFHADKIFGRKYNEKEILYDMIYCLHRFGFSYDEYFLYRLYDKNTAGKNEFISDKMRFEYYYHLNTEEGIKLLRDKGKTYELLGQFFKRDCVAVYSDDDFEKFQDFVKRHPQFIYKPVGLGCGEGVREIDASDHQTEQLCKELFENGAFIAEEIVVQSEDMAKFHNQSLNTVRVTSVLCKDGIHILFSTMRMGRGNSEVDNACSGGVFASVDSETGVVISKAVSEYGDDQYIFHPDTGEKILGFQLPEWEQVKQLVKIMAALVPGVKYIGWDFAHTNEGWLLLEANGTGMILSQMADKIGIKRKFLQLMKKA